MAVEDLIRWFAGGSTPYMNLVHCMAHDWLWIAITVLLDLAIAAGYGLIALHWWTNQKQLPPGPPKAALGTMRNIFVFCGICGYLFIPIKMVWPAWRLYDLFLAVLAYFTWRYAWNARDLKVIYREIHRSRQLEIDLEQSRADSRRKSQFLNAISHDLRTPLNGMLLQTHLAELHAGPEATPELREALAEIKACAQSTADMLTNFLELGRLDWDETPNQLSTFDLATLIGHVVQPVQVQAESKGVVLTTAIPPRLRLRTDPFKLERIVANLVSNALKFTDAGRVVVRAGRSKAGVRIAVEDTGQGIAPDDQNRLFEEFFQVNNAERDRAKGFGLGLAIARRLARQLGGDITVASELGRGSRFTVSLPAGVLVSERVPSSPPTDASLVSGTD